ncbi:hypothetical protein [Pseudoalteromonas piscicida]|uniref:Uncharacterized protein n=1 Tax=Pseudoalteromonas piscicida TaxID=43662 RepID=A0A2A5JQT4_PSEO7|nr:hypothetical protein [Pseudoalteromonas piscicida]PCK31727.1 hypothetical protein CEX98_10765 [Pseudoalteromonas piscicida]
MYWIKQLLRLLIVTVVLLACAWAAFGVFTWLKSAEPMNTSTQFNIRSNVHWLKTNTPLTFSFSASRTMSIRVLSNGIFESAPIDEQPTNYAIEYQLFDAEDKLVYEGIYHHAAKVASDALQQQVKQLIENREALAVSSGQSFYLNKAELQQADTVKLKLIPEDPQLKGVVVRVHAQTSNSITDGLKAWLKRPTEWRERMTNYHTIGENAVTNEEKFNSVMLDWQKLAPQGVPNVDFRADLLYESLPYNVLNHDFSMQQNLDNLLVSEQLQVSFRVYNNTQYLIHHAEQAGLQLTWHDLQQRKAPMEVNLSALSSTQSLVSELPPGLITVTSQSATSVRIFSNEIDPVTPLQSYYYMLDSQTAAHYQVSPHSDIALAWRAEFGDNITVSLFNQDKLVAEYVFTATAKPSRFDRLITETTARQQVMEEEKRYLSIPNNVDSIKVTSKGAMVKLQSRRPDFTYLGHRCASLCDPRNPQYQGIDAWFSQKADNHYVFHTQQQVATVRLFEVPPEVPNAVPQYISKDLNPVLPVSDIALLPIVKPYFDLSANHMEFEYRQTTKAELFALDKQSSYPPSVIIKQRRKPTLIEIPLSTLSTDDLTHAEALYINQGASRTLRKIRVYQLAKDTPLTVNVAENGLLPTALVIKLFSTDIDATINVETQLNATKSTTPNAEYTITNKHFVLHPDLGSQQLFFHPAHSVLQEYPSITLPMFDDLTKPNTLTLRSSHSVWISVLEEHLQANATLNWWQHEIP